MFIIPFTLCLLRVSYFSRPLQRNMEAAKLVAVAAAVGGESNLAKEAKQLITTTSNSAISFIFLASSHSDLRFRLDCLCY